MWRCHCCLRQALQLYKGDVSPVILEIINTVEGGPPVDVLSARSMWVHCFCTPFLMMILHYVFSKLWEIFIIWLCYVAVILESIIVEWYCRYEHFAKSASTILDDSLSADAYLNILYMPSTFPRSERSRQSRDASEGHSLSSSSEFEDGPRSNLDNVRYAECIYYLQEVRCTTNLFWDLKLGRKNKKVKVILEFVSVYSSKLK